MYQVTLEEILEYKDKDIVERYFQNFSHSNLRFIREGTFIIGGRGWSLRGEGH